MNGIPCYHMMGGNTENYKATISFLFESCGSSNVLLQNKTKQVVLSIGLPASSAMGIL